MLYWWSLSNFLHRFVNAAGVQALALQIVGTNDSEKCEVMEVAIDGIYLDKPRLLPFGRSLLISATRLDWIVLCNVPGFYEVKSRITSYFFVFLFLVLASFSF